MVAIPQLYPTFLFYKSPQKWLSSPRGARLNQANQHPIDIRLTGGCSSKMVICEVPKGFSHQKNRLHQEKKHDFAIVKVSMKEYSLV